MDRLRDAELAFLGRLGRATLFGLLGLLALGGGLTGTAFADEAPQRTVVLRAVSGPGGAALTQALGDWLSDRYTYTSDALYAKTARDLGRTGNGVDDVRAVLAELDADALVAGHVKGGTVYLVLRDASGVVAGTVEAPLPRRLGPRALAEIEAQLGAAIDALPTQIPPATPPPPSRRGAPRGQPPAAAAPANGGEGETPAAPEGATPESGTENGNEGEPGSGNEPGNEVTPERTVATSVAAGAAVAARSAVPASSDVTLAVGPIAGLHTIALASGGGGYRSAIAPGARIEVAFMPFALASGVDHPALLDHFGLFAEDEVDPFASASVANAPNGATLQTHEQRWAGGARFRGSLGRALVLADAGYGEWLVDVPPTAIAGAMPSFTDHLLLLRLATALPISERVAIEAAAAYLPLVETELLPTVRFGNGSGGGFEGRAAIDLDLGSSFYLSAGASLAHLALGFDDADLAGRQSTSELLIEGFALLGYRS